MAGMADAMAAVRTVASPVLGRRVLHRGMFACHGPAVGGVIHRLVVMGGLLLRRDLGVLRRVRDVTAMRGMIHRFVLEGLVALRVRVAPRLLGARPDTNLMLVMVRAGGVIPWWSMLML